MERREGERDGVVRREPLSSYAAIPAVLFRATIPL